MLTLMLATTAFGQDLKIVNGTEAQQGEFPEVVAVLSGSGGAGGICTGSLIHPNWVLTAAHCWDSIDLSLVPDGDTTVFFGERVGQAGTNIASAEVFVHPAYISIGFSPNAIAEGNDGTENDIALIRLREPATSQLMALNDAQIDNSWIDLEVTFIGFGITAFEGTGSGIKRYVNSKIFSYENARVFAFDPATGNSTCQGDSGGPGVRVDGTGAYVQFSVTAFGVECGTSPGGHMRVDAYIDDFIRTTMDPDDVITTALRPPTFECSHQLDPDDPNSIAIGVVPMDLNCSVLAAGAESITEVEWTWGDGTTESIPVNDESDLQQSHNYDTQGVYSVSACITQDLEGNLLDHCVVKTNHVSACGVPEAEFEVEQADGLVLDLINKTPLRAFNCISNATWEIYEGGSVSGEPVRSVSGWEPEIDMSDQGPGEYTVVLNVGGLGGTGAAMAVVEVGRSGGCATVSPAAGWGVFLAPLALLGLRRRT